MDDRLTTPIVRHTGGAIYEVEGKTGTYRCDSDKGTCTCLHFLYRCLESRRLCKHLELLAEVLAQQRNCPACHGAGALIPRVPYGGLKGGPDSYDPIPCCVCAGTGRREMVEEPVPAVSDLPDDAALRKMFR